MLGILALSLAGVSAFLHSSHGSTEITNNTDTDRTAVSTNQHKPRMLNSGMHRDVAANHLYRALRHFFRPG